MASQSMEVVTKALEQQMLQSARIVEEQLDTELNKLERMDEDELEQLKERRLEALKKAQKQKQVVIIGFSKTAFKCCKCIALYIKNGKIIIEYVLKQIEFPTHTDFLIYFVMCLSSGVDIQRAW